MKKVWITRDGEEIPIVDMKDSHVVNTIRYFRRHFPKVRETECIFNGKTCVLTETVDAPINLKWVQDEALKRGLLDRALEEIPKDGTEFLGWYDGEWYKIRWGKEDQWEGFFDSELGCPIVEPERWMFIDEFIE